MSSNRFVGIAYWSVTTSVSDWLARALDLLMPLERAGIAVIGLIVCRAVINCRFSLVKSGIKCSSPTERAAE